MAGERIFVQNFESFSGLDLENTPLTATANHASESLNIRFNEGFSLQGRYGYQQIGQPNIGFVSSGNLSYFDSTTGATQQVPFGINRDLFYLKEGYFTITRTGGSTDWDYTFGPASDGLSYQFIIYQGGSVYSTISVTSTTTVYALVAAIDALANFSCAFPSTIERGVVSGTQAPVASASINVDIGHTYQVGDVLTAINYHPTDGYHLWGGIVQSTGATTIGIRNDLQVSLYLNDDQILGAPASLASGIQFKNTNPLSLQTSNTIDVDFPYWEWAFSNCDQHPSFNTHYLSALNQNADWTPASSGSFNGRAIIGSAGAGYPSGSNYRRSYEPFPRCFDGIALYRAGLPKPVLSNVTQATGAGTLTLLGRYEYRIVFKHYLKNGDIVFSQPSDAGSITLTGSNNTVSFDVYLPRFAPSIRSTYTVATNGSNVNTISVVSNAFSVDVKELTFLDRDPSPDRWTRRAVTGFSGSQQVSIDGPPVDVNAGDTIYLKTFEGLNQRSIVLSNSGASQILVVSGVNTFRPADIITINDSTANQILKRNVVTSTFTSITVDGPPIDSSSGARAASNGMTYEVYRTTAGGNLFYKVGEKVVFSDCGSTVPTAVDTFTDLQPDSALGEQLIEPEIGKERDPPPAARIITPHQGGVVYTGIEGEDNAVAWNSIADGPENAPLASNYTDIASNFLGPISAAMSDENDSVLIFKQAASYALSGDLDSGAFVSRALTEGDYGVASQSSLLRQGGLILGIGFRGIRAFSSGGVIKDFATEINPKLINNPLLNPGQAVSVNDYANKMLTFFIPQRSGVTSPEDVCYCYDYESDAWFQFNPAYNSSFGTRQMAAGAVMYRNALLWLSRRGYLGLLTTGGDSFYETNYGRYTGQLPQISPRWLYSWGLDSSNYRYSSDWIHLGSPSIKKIFLRFKLWRFVRNEENYTIPRAISYQITFYRDYYEEREWYSTTVTLENKMGDFEATVKLPSGTARALKFTISTVGVNTALHTLFISGWELAVDGQSYAKTDILTNFGTIDSETSPPS